MSGLRNDQCLLDSSKYLLIVLIVSILARLQVEEITRILFRSIPKSRMRRIPSILCHALGEVFAARIRANVR